MNRAIDFFAATLLLAVEAVAAALCIAVVCGIVRAFT